MAKMTVKLYTTLRDKIGIARVDIEAATAAEAIDILRSRYADAVNQTLVDQNGVVRNHFTLTLNSQILDPLKLKDVQVNDGDLLHIFPPIAGGAGVTPPPSSPKEGGCNPPGRHLPSLGEGWDGV